MNDAYWDKNYKKITKKIIEFSGGTGSKTIKTTEWFEPINSVENSESISINEVINFIEKEITPKAEVAEKGEAGAEGVWMELLLNWLKQLAIEATSKALEYLLDKGVDWAVDGAGFALERLQDFLFDKYQASSDTKQKENFKKKILEKFPDSGLASKLSNE